MKNNELLYPKHKKGLGTVVYPHNLPLYRQEAQKSKATIPYILTLSYMRPFLLFLVCWNTKGPEWVHLPQLLLDTRRLWISPSFLVNFKFQ